MEKVNFRLCKSFKSEVEAVVLKVISSKFEQLSVTSSWNEKKKMLVDMGAGDKSEWIKSPLFRKDHKGPTSAYK